MATALPFYRSGGDMFMDGFDATGIGIGTQRGIQRRSAHVPVPDFPQFNLSGVEHAKEVMRTTLTQLLQVGGGMLRQQDFDEAVENSVMSSLGFMRQRGELYAAALLEERLSVLVDDPSCLDALALVRSIHAAYLQGFAR